MRRHGTVLVFLLAQALFFCSPAKALEFCSYYDTSAVVTSVSLFYSYRPGIQGELRRRDLEFQWSDQYSGASPSSNEQLTLDRFGDAIAGLHHANPFGADYSKIQLVHDYFHQADRRYNAGTAVKDSVGFLIGGYWTSASDSIRDRGHIDHYIFTPDQGQADGALNTVYPFLKYCTNNEDASTGRSASNCAQLAAQGATVNEIETVGPYPSLSIDTTGTHWASPDSTKANTLMHEFQHAMPFTTGGSMFDEVFSTAAEAVSGIGRLDPMKDDVPYTWSLLGFGPGGGCSNFTYVGHNYWGWRGFAAYLAYNFRGSDTTATIPAIGGTSGFGDDLLWKWARSSNRNLADLRSLLNDTDCWDCAHSWYFSGLDNYARLNVLYHNWRVANYVNNPWLSRGQYGYPVHFGYTPGHTQGAWQDNDNYCNPSDDPVSVPPAVMARQVWASKDTTIVGTRNQSTATGNSSYPMKVQPYGSEYWVVRSEAALSDTTTNLVVRVTPEGVYRGEGCPSTVMDGHLMASVAWYTGQPSNLWDHPEYADSVSLMQGEDVDSLAGDMQFVVPAFGGTHKAAVPVITMGDGHRHSLQQLAQLGITTGLPYRVSFALARAPYVTPFSGPSSDTYAAAATSDYESSPTWSPAGSEIAYVDVGGGGTGQIKRKAFGGSASTVSSSGSSQRDPDWSPRGDWIAFVQDSSGGASHVYLKNVDTGELRKIAYGSVRCFSPSFQPDGQALIYAVQTLANPPVSHSGWTIRRRDLNGSGDAVYLATSPGTYPDDGMMTSLRWKPAGDSLYLSRNDSLFAIRAGSNSLPASREAMVSGISVTSFDWPRGTGRLVVEQPGTTTYNGSCGVGFRRVALVDTTVSPVDVWTRFYRTSATLSQPRWSPDGTRVAYATSQNDPTGNDVYIGLASFNHAPLFTHTLDDQVVTPGQSFTLNLGATDGDGDNITYSGAFLPSGSSISDSTFTWSSPPVNCGDVYVVFRAADPVGGVAQKVVKISTRPAYAINVDKTFGNHKVVLTWEEPDQGDCNAAKYLVRSSTSTITEGNFDAAALVDSTIAPGSEGTTHCLEVDGLSYCSPTTYNFAIKTRRAGFWSAMSGVASGVPTCSGSKPFCDEDGLMAGGGDGGGESMVSRGLGTDHARLTTQSLNLIATPSSNSLFASPTGTDESDLLKLSSSANTDSSVEVRLSQSGDRQAHLDYLGLAIVDHDPEVSTFAGQSNVFAGVPQEVTSIRDAGGQDISGSIGESYTAQPGDQLFVGLSQGAHPALLVESRGEPGVGSADSVGIIVQKKSGEGWSTVATLQPRREFETSAVDDANGDTLRLVFLHSYAVRSIAQLTSADVIQPQAVQLTSAEHSRLGSVQDSVGTADGNGATLLSGDELTLTAHVSAPEGGKTRDAYLLGTGGFRQPLAEGQGEVGPNGGRSAALVVTPVWYFALGAARPNPSLGNVTIEYTLAQQIPVSIRVYDVAGRLVKTLVSGTGTPGPHDITWNAADDHGRKVGAGVYFYRMNAGNWQSQRKVVFLEH